jgi:hypothetical protein
MATTASLRPLSLAQRPLQLRSDTPVDPQSHQASPATTSCHVNTPKPSVDRQHKRYSTLPYANSNSPSLNGSFASPLQSPITPTILDGLSRSSSRSGARGSVSDANGPKKLSGLHGNQPVAPANGGERGPDLSSINDILAHDSSWRSPTEAQSVAGTEASSAAVAVSTLAETLVYIH